MKKRTVMRSRETIPRKVKGSFIGAEEIRMIKQALKNEKPLKKKVECLRKTVQHKSREKKHSQKDTLTLTFQQQNCQKDTVIDRSRKVIMENLSKDFGLVVDERNNTNNPIQDQLNKSGLSHFMDLEERKDLLISNIDDPLCINGPETYDAVGWVPIKQEPIDADDLEVSRITITELPFSKPIEERRPVWTCSDPQTSPLLFSSTESDVENLEESNVENLDVNRTSEGDNEIVVENILKKSNTKVEKVKCVIKTEVKQLVNDNKEDDDDSEQEIVDDDNDDDNYSNEVDSSVETTGRTKRKSMPHKCDLCNKILSSKGSLRIHKKKIHNIVLKFNCELCLFNSDLQRDLIKHRNEEHRSDDGRFSCKECGKYFSDYRGFLVHLKSHFDDLQMFDKEEGNYKCSECDKLFTRVEGLQLHKAMSHNTDSAFGEKLKQQQKNHVCDTCGMRFAFGCLLRDHVNLHTGYRPYLCQQCGRCFAQKASLKQHVRTHNSVRPFQCSVCNQGFYGKGDLKKHSRRHTGERPYVCEMCGDSFSQSSHLGVHIRSHTGERPFKCDFCSRGFCKRGDVVRHRRIHTGELPYLCQVCGKAFRQSAQRGNHIKNHHPDAYTSIVTSNYSVLPNTLE